MTSAMDREIPITGWQAAWMERELPALRYYTLGLTYTLSGVLIVLGVRTLIGQRRTYRALEANPSSRAQINAAHEKQIARTSRRHYYVSVVFMLNALVIYLVDVGVGLSSIGHDAAAIPWSTDPSFVLTFGLFLLTAIVLLLSAFLLAPMMQIAFVSWWIARRFPGEARRSLADHASEARIAVTYMAQLWAMLQFFLVAWWPVGYHSIVRVICYVAACGSVSVWMDASFAFNFCIDRLDEVELTGLSTGVARIVRMFGQDVVAVHSFGKGGELPKYEPLVQTEEYSEKEAL